MGAGMQRSSMALCHRLWITGSALENGAGGKERWTSVGTPGPCPAAGNSCSSESSSNCQWYTLDHIQPLRLFQETVRGKWELKNSKLFFKLTSDYILPFPHQAEGAERGLEEISFLLYPASTFHPPQGRRKPCEPLLQPEHCKSLQTEPWSFSCPSRPEQSQSYQRT